MIAASLVVVLLVAREVLPSGVATRTLNRMLVPAAIGFGLVAALRIAELVVDRA